MENLNAEQVKKALGCCINRSCGVDCPYYDAEICTLDIMRDALALINSQEQRIKELTEENEKLSAQKYYIHSDGRIEMVPTVESVRSDTVRKMHFEIQQRCIKRGIYPLLVGYTVDQVAYEITGDDYFKPRYMLECKE